MKYAAAEMHGDGTPPAFRDVYERLRKDGLEIDVESAGFAYMEELSSMPGADSVEDVLIEAGYEFDQTVRSYLLSDLTETNAEGEEKQIGNLSPSQEITRRIIRAFKAEGIEDNSTKSALRQIQDMYAEALRRISPKEKDGTKVEDKRTWEEVIEDGLKKMNIGQRDIDGNILNLETMHKDVNKQLAELTQKLRDAGKDAEADKLEAHVKSFQDAVYSIQLNSKEARKVVEGALVEKGFAKVNTKGEIVIDWAKASNQLGTVSEIRKNVVEAMVDAGHPQFVAERIADNLSREFIDAKTTMARIAGGKYDPTTRQAAAQGPKKPAPKVEDVLYEYMRGFENYRKLAEKPGAKLSMSKKLAKDLMYHILEKNGLIKKYTTGSGDRINLEKMADQIANPTDIRDMVEEYLINQGYSKEMVEMGADAMENMYADLVDKMKEYVQGTMESIEQSWQPQTTSTKAPIDIADIISKRMADVERARKQLNDPTRPLIFKRTEAHNILATILSETADFGKGDAADRKLDWRKLSGADLTEAQLRDIVEERLLGEGYDPAEISQISDALTASYKELITNAKEHAQSVLDAKERIVERSSPERQSAVQALAELQAMGVFEGAREKLLMSSIGLDKMSVDDMNEIKELTAAYTQASQMAGTRLGESMEATVEKGINRIVERNQANKARMMKVGRFVNKWLSLHNFTLISNTWNLVQNLTTGALSSMQAKLQLAAQTGTTKFKEGELWRKVGSDVAMGGASTDASGKFGYVQTMGELNSLDFKANPVKALKTLSILMYRAALNGADAAHKAVIRNYDFLNIMHKALEKAGWTKEDATEWLYESMYGEKREQVQQQARQIIDQFGEQMGVGKSKAAKERAAIKLADDMIKGNLQLAAESGNFPGKPPISPETVRAAFRAAKTGAGIALGHEANNRFSKDIQAGRAQAKREYDQLVKAGRYSEAGTALLWNTVWYDGVKRLAAGGANWAWLTLDSAGLGLRNIVTGKYSRVKQEPYDPSNPKAMEDAMRRTITYENEAGRAIVGLTQALVAFGAMAALGAVVRDDEDEGVMQAAGEHIDKSYLLSNVAKRMAGPLGYAVFLSAKSDGMETEEAIAEGLDVAANILRLNQTNYSPATQIQRGIQSYKKGDTEHAWGKFGQAAGSIFPSIPIFPAYHKLYKDISYVLGEEKEQSYSYLKPQNFVQGMLYKKMEYDLIRQIPEKDLEIIGFENWGKEKEIKPRK
jgi:hypothetical protein